MKKTVKFDKRLIILLIMITSFKYTWAQLPPTDPAYQVVFGDDFNDTTGYNGRNIDPSKWIGSRPWNNGSTTKTVNYGPPVGSVTYDVAGYNFNFTDTSNIHVVPDGIGVCRLIARKGNLNSYIWDFSQPNPYIPAVFKYSNGALSSRKKIRFGYFEIRFRLPSNVPTPNLDNNYLPTCWLFNGSDSLNPPVHSEIDIYEIDGRTNRLTNSVYFKHFATTPNLYKDHEPNVAIVTSGVWHTASVDWTKEHIDFYYDGNFVRREANNHADSLVAMQTLIEAYVPNEWTQRNVDSVNTIFPYVYEIDYYKVWQLKEACDTSKTYTNATAASFDSKLYKDLTFTGNCNFSNGNVSALGVDFVLLDAGTTIGANMEMIIDIKPCNNNIVAPALIQIPEPTNDAFKQSRHKP